MSTGKSSNSYDLLREKPEESGTTPFWRTKTGKIVIGIIVALVIIGAVVGGAVGGTLSNKTTSVKSSSSSPGVVSGSGTSGGQPLSPTSTASSSFSIPDPIFSATATQGTGRGGLTGLTGLTGGTGFGNQDMGATPTPVSNNTWIRHRV